MTLKTQLTYWVECYKDVAERNALAETPKESAEYLLSLILAEVDKAALTEAQINKAKQDYLEGKYDRELITFKVTRKNWQEVTIAAAQLEAIKKQLRG